MKKYFAILLCAIMVFRVAAAPALAADLEPEMIPYSQNFAGDVISFTDADGHIIEVRPNDATTYSAAAGALLIQSSGGAMGAGAASILAPALPILGYILAAGVVVYSVVGLANCVMDMYYLLSDAARAELDAIAESGSDSFSLADNPNLAAELPTIYGETFFTDDGSFINSGVTFDPSNLLEYNYEAQWVYGNDLTSSVYKYALGSTPVAIDGTSLSVSLVDSPFVDWADAPKEVNKVFKITNSVTGASLTWLPSYTSAWLEDDHRILKVSAPAVETYTGYNGFVYHSLGFWVLGECTKIAAGETCDTCYYRYWTKYFGEGDDLFQNNYILFEGTGIAGLDGVLIDGQWLNGTTWDLEYAVAMDGVDSITLPNSALQTIATDLTYAMALTDAAALPEEEDKVYLPPAAALADANTLTQTGAQTGTWEETLVESPSVPEVDEGFWSKLVNAIKDAILSLFIPSEGFFEEFISDITGLFEDRMGILTYPISVLYNFFDHLLDIGEEEPVLKWSSWSYKDVEVIPAGSFNFNDLLENETFSTIHDIYLLLVDVGIVFGLVALLRKKYDSIISN